MVNVLAAVILIPIALILVASLGGVAIGLVFDVNTSAWDVGTATLWELIPLIAIVAIFLAFLAVVGLKVSGKI